MNNVRKVRKSIAKRNKIRSLSTRGYTSKKIMQPFPQEEEKHGFYPVFQANSSEDKQKSVLMGHFLLKGILSIILFFVVAIVLQSNIELLEKPKKWTSHVMSEEFPFARAHQWYQETFGTPLAFSPQNIQTTGETEEDALPVMGNVTQSFQTNGTGIMITPTSPSPVTAWRDGIIIFAGSDKEMKKTVIIQHADRSKTTYGLLSSLDVHLYQYVSKNQRIGTFNPTEDNESVFFSIEKNDEFIDPIQVIKVDDLP